MQANTVPAAFWTLAYLLQPGSAGHLSDVKRLIAGSDDAGSIGKHPASISFKARSHMTRGSYKPDLVWWTLTIRLLGKDTIITWDISRYASRLLYLCTAKPGCHSNFY